jgi:hypothetical protein
MKHIKLIKHLEGVFESPAVYKDFFSTKLLDQITSKIPDPPNDPEKMKPLTQNGEHWDNLGGFISLNDDKEICKKILNEVNSVYDTSHINWYDCGIQIFGGNTYLPWHDDAAYSFTMTTYLNQKWDWNWGGSLLCLQKDGEIRAEFPEYNKTVFISGTYSKDNKMAHGISYLHPAADLRISLQLFGSTEKSNPAIKN